MWLRTFEVIILYVFHMIWADNKMSCQNLPMNVLIMAFSSMEEGSQNIAIYSFIVLIYFKCLSSILLLVRKWISILIDWFFDDLIICEVGVNLLYHHIISHLKYSTCVFLSSLLLLKAYIFYIRELGFCLILFVWLVVVGLYQDGG